MDSRKLFEYYEDNLAGAFGLPQYFLAYYIRRSGEDITPKFMNAYVELRVRKLQHIDRTLEDRYVVLFSFPQDLQTLEEAVQILQCVQSLIQGSDLQGKNYKLVTLKNE